jgi:hypothetical protein
VGGDIMNLRLIPLLMFCLCMLMVGCCRKSLEDTGSECPVIFDGRLSFGYGMGLNTSEGLTDWIAVLGDSVRMAYPGGQQWGAVFITFGGDPVDPPRPSIDLSHCNKLEVELRGENGGEIVAIGIKDNTDPDDGSEVRKIIHCQAGWVTYQFDLSDFTNADKTRLYVVAEFVFDGTDGRTVYFRRIQYTS